MFIGWKVNSESSFPVLIGWNVTPFSHGIYRLAENVSLLIWLMGVKRCSASKSNKKSVRNKKTYSSKEDTSKIQKKCKKTLQHFKRCVSMKEKRKKTDIFAFLSSVLYLFPDEATSVWTCFLLLLFFIFVTSLWASMFSLFFAACSHQQSFIFFINKKSTTTKWLLPITSSSIDFLFCLFFVFLFK